MLSNSKKNVLLMYVCQTISTIHLKPVRGTVAESEQRASFVARSAEWHTTTPNEHPPLRSGLCAWVVKVFSTAGQTKKPVGRPVALEFFARGKDIRRKPRGHQWNGAKTRRFRPQNSKNACRRNRSNPVWNTHGCPPHLKRCGYAVRRSPPIKCGLIFQKVVLKRIEKSLGTGSDDAILTCAIAN